MENKCKREECAYEHLDGNEYCGKHQVYIFIDETERQNKHVCSNYLRRGCLSQLSPEYKFARCESCRETERNQDKLRRDAAKSKSEQTDPNATEKQCTVCCKVYALEHFQGVKCETKTCISCREQNKIQDKKRDKDHRNALGRVYDSKPERRDAKRKVAVAEIET